MSAESLPQQRPQSVPNTGVEAGTKAGTGSGGFLLSSLRRTTATGQGPGRSPSAGDSTGPTPSAPSSDVRQLSQSRVSPPPASGQPDVEDVGGTVAGGPDGITPEFLAKWFVHQDAYYAVNTAAGWAFVDRPLTDSDLQRHVRGEVTLGLYPIANDGTVKYCAWDLDSSDSGDLYSLLGGLTPPYLVLTTGHRGYHVYQFFNPPVTAWVAKAYAEATATGAGLSIECNPKQSDIGPRRPGQNLLRLPFGVHRKTGRRSKLEFGTFDYSTPPLPEYNGHDNAPRAEKSEVATGWIASLWAGDVPEGRNHALNRLRWWLERRDFPTDVVYMVCEAANNLQSPPLDDEEFGKVMRRR